MKLAEYLERFAVRLGGGENDFEGDFKLIGVSGQTINYNESGVIVVYDTENDYYRLKKYKHCSRDGTFTDYEDDETKYLCGGNEVIDQKILANCDPRMATLDRMMDWRDIDAEEVAVLILHRACENSEIAAFVEEFEMDYWVAD